MDSKFFSLHTKIYGTGVVILTNNQIFGGDAEYYYTGYYNIKNELLDGEVEVTHFGRYPQAVFGQRTNAKIKISGQIQEHVMKLTGYLVDSPNGKLEITCTKRISKNIDKKREGLFYKGQYYDAQRVVKNIFSSASQKILIIDNYIDESVLNLLTAKNQTVEINILTKSITPDIKVSATAFKKQYGKLSIRTSKSFHDRFVITDEQNFYHFGASIKDLGNLAFMFSLIEEPVVINSIKTKFSQELAIASVEI